MREPEWFRTACTWITRINAAWSLWQKASVVLAGGGTVTSLLRWFGSGWPSAVGLGCVTILLGLLLIYGIEAISKRRRGSQPSLAPPITLLDAIKQIDTVRPVTKSDVLKRSDQIDLEYHLPPSSSRTGAKRAERARENYDELIKMAIEGGLKPPPAADNVERSLQELRQWCREP